MIQESSIKGIAQKFKAAMQLLHVTNNTRNIFQSQLGRRSRYSLDDNTFQIQNGISW